MAEQETKEGKGKDFRYIVRIANTDLDGNRSVVYALTGIKGVGVRIAEIIADQVGVPRTEKIGNLSEQQVERIEEILNTLGQVAPPWLLNRQKEFYTGEDIHVFGADLDVSRRGDINRMKMIRCYKGIRHEQGQKVRGQRTRSNGRTGLTVGVIKRAVVAAQQAKAEEQR